jgi:ATP-dependent Clp protease ATP-binding subunit ClpA
LLDALPPGAETVAERPPFTITAKQMLDQAVREATKLGHDYVGTEHLLLAALRQPEGLPPEVVRTFALSYDAAARAVAELLAEPVGLRARIARGR